MNDDGDGERSAVVPSDAWHASFSGSLDGTDFASPGGRLASFVYDVGYAIHPRTRDPVFVLAEEFESTPDRVSITLKSGLEWSNGEPLTAADLGRWVTVFRIVSPEFASTSAVVDGREQPQNAWEAITDVDWDGRTLTVEGAFDRAPDPLFELNTYLGSRPRTYYDWLWEEFQAAYDGTWVDDAARDRVTSLVAENIWSVESEHRPGPGVQLEDDYDGSGWEAAFSGLWYPTRADNSRLYFAVNEGHPFADRVTLDEVVWTFRDAPDTALYDLQSGIVDGAMLSDVTSHVTESVPSNVESFEGPARNVVTLTVNQSIAHFRDRDVRAALAYAIDREALERTVDLVTRRHVEVPGGDLQSERWLPGEHRDAMRSYDYDPDRASDLLERAGFRRGGGGGWRTPDGERFAFTILTPRSSPTLLYAILSQLNEFGIETDLLSIEETSYQARRESGFFTATHTTLESPNAAGLRQTRAGDHVRTITRRDGFPDSAYLKDQISTAIENSDQFRWGVREFGGTQQRYLDYDSVEALRSITVEAPPFGDPDGDLREWPYLYHATQVKHRHDLAEKIEHARICSWIYNYQVPEVELLIGVPRVFHDTENWTVPDDGDPAWRYVQNTRHPGGLWAALAWGHVDRS